MESKDYIAIVALVVSLFTFYWIHLKGSKFVCPPIRKIRIDNFSSGDIIIGFSFALHNSGSADGVIDYVFLDIEGKESKKNRYRFWAYYEKPVNEKENAPKPSIENMPKAFAVSKGNAVVKDFWFSPHDPNYIIKQGKFILSLFAVVIGSNRPKRLLKQEIEIVDIEPGKFVCHGFLFSGKMIK